MRRLNLDQKSANNVKLDLKGSKRQSKKEHSSSFTFMNTQNQDKVQFKTIPDMVKVRLDNCWYGVLFATSQQNQQYLRNRKAYGEHYQKQIGQFQRNNNSMKQITIQVQKPHSSKYCQICRMHYTDYRMHIHSSEHLLKKNSQLMNSNLQLLHNTPIMMIEQKQNIVYLQDQQHQKKYQEAQNQTSKELKNFIKGWKHLTKITMAISQKL